jgi:glycosyltransferase involved in cell wall biosynthesis
MRWKFDMRPARGLARLIGRERFALVHTHTPRSAMIGCLAARWAGVPMVHHVHGHTANEVGAGWRHRFNAWVEKKCLCRAAKVIAVSQSSAVYMAAQGMPSGRLVVVPNGITPRRLAERDPPEGGWTLGIVGLFRRRKGLEVLLRAMAHLRRHRQDVRLRAVGPFETVEYEAEIHRLCAELQVDDQVEWRGFQSDVAAELEAMDLFVFPSLLPEGMPMVLLEAMAAGVPVVATAVDGATDVLRDGRDGLLVPPGNPFELAAAVARVMIKPDLWYELREAAHARQATRFSDQSMAAGVADVYRGILGS